MRKTRKVVREAYKLVERPYVPFYELLKKLDIANKGVADLSVRLFEEVTANKILAKEVDRLVAELNKLQKIIRELTGREP